MTDYERVETDYFELLKYYEEDDFVDIDLWPGDNFVGHLMITIYGTKDTPYENGRFIFEIKTFNNYPFYPPGVFCHTRIWHPNIDIDKPLPTDAYWRDNVCFDIIDPDRIGQVDKLTHASGWTPTRDLVLIVECLKLMIHCYDPFFNCEDPLNEEAGEQCKQNKEEFDSKAKEWTMQYAR